jgi:hypothetical protein
MSERASDAPLDSRERIELAGVTALALLVPVVAAALGIHGAGRPLSHLGVFYDGHLYIEIARSFPLPFADAARDYLGQAPGYPALVALVRAVTPSQLVDWGGAALIASWIPAALSAGAFYLLCRDVGLSALGPSLLFLLANPRWLVVASGPRPEPLAMLLTIALTRAALRGRLGVAVGLLSALALVRFPALLLGAPLAVCFLLVSGPSTGRATSTPLRPSGLELLRRLAWLAVPLAVFGLYNLYLELRLSDFPGIWGAHRIFWDTHLTWPFSSLRAGLARRFWGRDATLYVLTYVSLAFYLLSVLSGFRLHDRRLWFLPLSTAVLVLFHASLSGLTGAWDFTRLVILAWPSALLCICLATPPLQRAVISVPLAFALGIFGFAFARGKIEHTADRQSRVQPFIEEGIGRLDDDEPRWIDFRALHRAAARRRDGSVQGGPEGRPPPGLRPPRGPRPTK